MKNLKAFFPLLCCFFLSCNNGQKNNSADKAFVKEQGSQERKIEARIYRNDTIPGSNLSGFGYDILIDGSPHIHQPHIPAIGGITGFFSEEDAHRTAEYAIQKMKKTNALPVLSKEELDSLGIKYH